MILHDSLGPVLAKARKGKRISQELVAEITEVSVWTIRNIEHGNTHGHMNTIFVLWDIYGLPRIDIWDYYIRDPGISKKLRLTG